MAGVDLAIMIVSSLLSLVFLNVWFFRLKRDPDDVRPQIWAVVTYLFALVVVVLAVPVVAQFLAGVCS